MEKLLKLEYSIKKFLQRSHLEEHLKHHPVPDNDDDDMDDVYSCDELVACLHADHDESEEDAILGPRKRPREEDDSPDLSSALKIPGDHCSPCKSLRHLLQNLCRCVYDLLKCPLKLLLSFQIMYYKCSRFE